MQEPNDHELLAKRERNRSKRVMALNAIEFKPKDSELERKRLEQQENS